MSGSRRHIVVQGECLSSIAARFGFDWRALWDHAENEALKKKRKDPNILYPGDEVFLPAKEPRWVSIAAGAHHRFEVKLRRETLRLRLLDELDRPRKGLKYELLVEGERIEGETNGDGEVVEEVLASAVNGQMFLGEERVEYALSFGGLDPSHTLTGLQARLANLGLDPGPCDGVLGPRTRQAICDFQEQLGLEPTGEADEKMIEELRRYHGR